ncbi:hypothetical protein V6N12_040523 [Hibiscus sabdariffa]|uniref:Uncharacterized protein n=1 Tax=Hibiscus sabdariffa TaxID=183260 RepID=A0ABR2E5X9_9ROSI
MAGWTKKGSVLGLPSSRLMILVGIENFGFKLLIRGKQVNQMLALAEEIYSNLKLCSQRLVFGFIIQIKHIPVATIKSNLTKSMTATNQKQ